MRREVYRGRVVRLGIEEARLPNGRTTELEIVRHDGAAAVVALDERGRVALLRQFRWAAGGELWEIPAGVLDPGDASAEACARRELAEEAGVNAGAIERLGRVLPTPGYSTEAIELFLARELEATPTGRGVDEVITEVRWVTLAEALAMIDRGDVVDAKTIVGLHLAARRLGGAA